MPDTPASEIIPLTPLQQGMFFTWLQDPAAGIDLEQMVCTLPEAIDAPRLRAAWETLTATHDILRTTFTAESATLHSTLPTPWQETGPVDLATFLEKDRTTPFDLPTGPLQRLTLIQITPTDYRLIWTFHHILLDGRAITALLQQVFALYDHPADPPHPPQPSFQSHNHWLHTLDHTASAPFWKVHLTGITGPTPLIVDHLTSAKKIGPICPISPVGPISPTPPSQSETSLHLTPALTTALRTLAATHDLTLNTFVQAAFALLLGRYANEDRVIFGATRACRHTPVPGSQSTIGLLINTLPLAVSLPAGQPLLTLLETLRQHWLGLRPHEHTPLSFIRRSAGLSGTHAPFNHLLVFENDDYTSTLRATGGSAFTHRTFHLHELTSVPLTLAVFGSASLHLHCAYAPSTFDPGTIQRLLGHLANLLEQFATLPLTTPLSAFPLTTPAERQLLLHDSQPHDSGPDSATTLHAWFSQTAAKFPNRTAVTAEDTTWTYAQLDRHSDTIAHALITAGVLPGHFVGICMERRAPLIAALLGILKAGAAYLPIDLAYPPGRLAFMLEDAQAPILLTERLLASKIPPNPATTLFIEDINFDSPSQISNLKSQIPQSPDSLAYIIYTSGSTGLPKGCQITHRNVVRLMLGTQPWYHFNEHDIWTLFHSTAFDFSVWELWGALLYGGRLIVVPWLTTRSPDDFFKLLCEERVTVLNQTPSAFRQLIQAEPSTRAAHPHLPPQSLRYVIFGGEALEMQSLKPWYDRHGDTAPVLVNMYGITETTVHVTYRPLSSQDLDRGSLIGIPIPDLQLYILDPGNRQPVPIGIPGEMYIAGPGLATGYLRRDTLTADRFIPNHLTGAGRLYKTGDLARFLPRSILRSTGVPPVRISSKPPEFPLTQQPNRRDACAPDLEIEYLGRIDQQVKIRGFRIEPGEIENILITHPHIQEASVLAREDRPGEKRLCAYLVPADRTDPPTPEALRALLKTRVPDYMVPAAFVFLEKFPITPNGKLDRKALPAPTAADPSSRRPFLPPTTPAETILSTIWTQVLRLDRISTADNFFEIGGDSILSIQVIARARQAGLILTPRQLFQHPTITALAAVATPLKSQISNLKSPPPDLTSPFPLTPIQRWFFDQNLSDSHHWNQSFLFTLSRRLQPDLLHGALRTLLQHHSALRLRFHQENQRWTPSIAPQETSDLLTVLPNSENLAADCAHLQTTLNYQTGPLLRAALFDAGGDRPGHLFLTVHHLAIDGVSWRILLENLETLLAGNPLPPPTTSWPHWARQLALWPTTSAARKQIPYWNHTLEKRGAPGIPPSAGASAPAPHPPIPLTLESNTFSHTVTLAPDLTAALLQQAPAAYRTRINDLLLTALALAHQSLESSPSLSLDLEGHGREETLAPGRPLDRTIGWFTAIFPVSLTLPSSELSDAIPAIKEQLRAIPENGSGYQLLAQAAHPGIKNASSLLFNYLGQFDALTAGSKLFAFAPGTNTTGPWHSPRATRAHATTINAMIIGGQFETTFTSAASAHTPGSLASFANSFLSALKSVIAHCLLIPASRSTPSDFPLAALTQSQIDSLLPSAGSTPGDICRLSPGQQLFYNAALTKPGAGFDQWHCRLRGPLDPDALQAAWTEVIARHPILRTTFHSAGLPHPVMLVHPGSAPSFTRLDAEGPNPAIRLLASDASRVNDLTKPILSRFTLLRLAPDDHFLLWSVPDLQLDGWSWPLVFGEAAQLYRQLTSPLPDPAPLPAPRPYQEYLAWLQNQNPTPSDHFWQRTLAGLTAPTPIPLDTLPRPRSSRRTAEARSSLTSAAVSTLTTTARALGVTPGVAAQAAWAALLAHAAGHPDVVYGSAFSGRPAGLPGATVIIGPFVNNLPVRAGADPALPAATFLRHLHAHLTDLTDHQFTPLPRIQDQSAVPWSQRLFNSLLVFQNYPIDPALYRLGPETLLTDFNGPIHTNLPLTLVVTPSAGITWDLFLIHEESTCSPARAQLILTSFTALVQSFATHPEATLDQHLTALPLPCGCSPVFHPASAPARISSPPRSPMEQRLAIIWQRAFGLPAINITDNFFDLGGHSLLMLRVHQAICEELARPLPIITLFQYPTLATLAAHLDPAPTAPGAPSLTIQNRAAAARAATQRAAAARR